MCMLQSVTEQINHTKETENKKKTDVRTVTIKSQDLMMKRKSDVNSQWVHIGGFPPLPITFFHKKVSASREHNTRRNAFIPSIHYSHGLIRMLDISICKFDKKILYISPHSAITHGSLGRLFGPVATFSIFLTTKRPSPSTLYSNKTNEQRENFHKGTQTWSSLMQIRKYNFQQPPIFVNDWYNAYWVAITSAVIPKFEPAFADCCATALSRW